MWIAQDLQADGAQKRYPMIVGCCLNNQRSLAFLKIFAHHKNRITYTANTIPKIIFILSLDNYLFPTDQL